MRREVAAVQRDEGVRGGPVQPRPLVDTQPGLDGVADQVVHEAVLARCRGRLDQPERCGLVQRGEAAGFRGRRHRGDHACSKLATHDRCRTQDVPRRRRQPGEPGRDRLAHRRRDAAAGKGAVVKSRADLGNEERVATRAGMNPHRLGVRDRVPDQRGQLPTDGRDVQTTQPDLPGHRFAGQLGHQHRMRRLGVAMVDHQEQPLAAERPGEVMEQLQRRSVGPVRVVEDGHERPFPGHRVEQPGHRVEQAEPVLGRAVSVVRIGVPDHLGDEPCQVTCQAVLGGQPREVDLPGRGAQDLPPRPVRRRAVPLDAAAPHDRCAARRGERRELLRQAGLADAGLRQSTTRGRPASAAARHSATTPSSPSRPTNSVRIHPSLRGSCAGSYGAEPPVLVR